MMRIASVEQIVLGNLMELSITGQLLGLARQSSSYGGLSLREADRWKLKNHSHLVVAKYLQRLRPISLQRGRCLDRSAEATEGEVKALRAVAGYPSSVARQCRPDEAGTASTLQGSVSRAVVKDLSDANRAVNRLKQTEEEGLLIHAIPLVKFCTVCISDAALDLDRPDGSTQGGLMDQGNLMKSKPTKILKTNKKRTTIERRNPCDSEILEWLQEFRENLVDDEIASQGGSHASSSHEASLEPIFKRRED